MNYRHKLLNQQAKNQLAQKEQIWQQEKNILQQEHQNQLRKINLLFDPSAKNYKEIDFNGLYALLEKVKARGEKKPK